MNTIIGTLGIVALEVGHPAYFSNSAPLLLVGAIVFASTPRSPSGSGGGRGMRATPRCWTLAYGVMLDREWPDELPEGADAFLRSPRLRDAAPPALDPATQEKARDYAMRQVAELRRLVFPAHGLA